MNAGTRNWKNISRGIISVILGVGAAIVTFLILIFLFIELGLFGWSDGGDPKFLRRLEMTTSITFIISIAAAIFVFIIIFMRVNRKASKRL